MTGDSRQPLEREGLLFFGAVGAGLSHELSNVFNIVNELTGLQQDIIAAAEDDSSGFVRVADLAARIKSQAGRGEEINRSLHGFSHSLDDPDVVFDIGDVLALFGSLAGRATRLAEVELEVQRPEKPIAYRGDPFALLLALHACLQLALATATSGRRIGVRAEPAGSGVRVIVSSADPLLDLDDDALIAESLRVGCAALGAAPEFESYSGEEQCVVLNLAAGSEGVGGVEDDREAEV